MVIIFVKFIKYKDYFLYLILVFLIFWGNELIIELVEENKFLLDREMIDVLL